VLGRKFYRDCPRKNNENSAPRCSKCTLKEGENQHPSNYRGCRHAREESLHRIVERASAKKITIRTVDFSSYATWEFLFAVELCGDSQPWKTERRQSQPQQREVGTTEGVREQAAVTL